MALCSWLHDKEDIHLLDTIKREGSWTLSQALRSGLRGEESSACNFQVECMQFKARSKRGLLTPPLLARARRYVLLANMFTATFASMWITNVAAPVLCFSLLQPILRTVPAQGRAFSKALVMGAPPGLPPALHASVPPRHKDAPEACMSLCFSWTA